MGASSLCSPKPHITHQRGGHLVVQFCDITQVVIPSRPVVHIGDYSPLDSVANYRQESDVFKSTLEALWPLFQGRLLSGEKLHVDDRQAG